MTTRLTGHMPPLSDGPALASVQQDAGDDPPGPPSVTAYEFERTVNLDAAVAPDQVRNNARMYKRLVVFIGTTSGAVATVLGFAGLVMKQAHDSPAQEVGMSVAWVGCAAFAVIALCATFEVLTANFDGE